MAKSAAEIEEDIDKALRRCGSLTAEGLWRRMRFSMEHDSDRRPYVRHDGTPVTTTEQLSFATGCSVVKVARALPRLLGVGLVKESAEGYFSPKIQRIIEVRASTARRVRECRERDSMPRRKSKVLRNTVGVLRNTQEGVTSDLCNTPVTPAPPPMVSPPITLSSLSPSDIPPEAVRAEVSEEVRRVTYAAFDQWSHASRGWGLDAAANENRKVAAMLDTLAQEPPIIRNGEPIGRHLLAAKAAEVCKRNSKDFKRIAYACEIVKSLLDDWEAKGVPGSNGPQKTNGQAVPARRVLPAVTKYEA